MAIAIFASKIFSLDFFQALHCHLLSSLIQVKHGLILWFKLQAPNSSLCYNSSALSPNLSTYTSDINTASFKETFECYHFYTFVYMPYQSVFYYIEICVLPKNKTQTTNFQKSVKDEPVCAFPPQSVHSV